MKTTTTKLVLTKEELKKLLRVKTTKKEARIIKKRNKGLLNFLCSLPIDLYDLDVLNFKTYCGDYDNFYGENGCPHCLWEVTLCKCDGCRWEKYWGAKYIKLNKLDGSDKCCKATFGGVTYLEVHQRREIDYVCVTYGCSSERANFFPHSIVGSEEEEREERFQEYLAQLEKCKKFVKGHIEWAEAVINKKSTRKTTKNKE